MIAILDYGVGNVGSIARVFEKLGAEVVVTTRCADVDTADQLVLPGVGSFDHGMRSLLASGLVEAAERRVRAGVPLLGICLGLQMLGRASEEGEAAGLGWLPLTSRHLSALVPPSIRVPHTGWSGVRGTRPGARLAAEPPSETEFYFSHSFGVVPDDPSHVTAVTDLGAPIPAVVEHDNVVGVQFHPEKSHSGGRRLLSRFLAMR